MQKSYISSIYKILKEDKNVISCLSDSGTDYDEMIARELPEQVINFGISENNKIAAASGLAACGKIPFVYTTNAFIAYRSYEFVRDDICLQNRNVKLVGMGSNLSWSTLGCTHHTTEDISALKALPNLILLNPASGKELEKCVEEAYKIKGPVYIRMGMSGEEEIYDDECNFVLGKNNIIRDGKDGVIFTSGPIISEVLKVRDKLKENDNLSLKIVNICSIKPFDNNSIINEAKNNKIIFSVEEQNVIGGVGSSIADVIAENNLDTKLVKIGLNDQFAKGYGTHQEILEQNNLDSESIYKKIKAILLK
jgi:transketolase